MSKKRADTESLYETDVSRAWVGNSEEVGMAKKAVSEIKQAPGEVFTPLVHEVIMPVTKTLEIHFHEDGPNFNFGGMWTAKDFNLVVSLLRREYHKYMRDVRREAVKPV